MYYDRISIDTLVGQIVTNIERVGDEKLIFETSDGSEYQMYHDQDCCESVYLQDVIGDLDDLVNSEIVLAEEVTNEGEEEYGTFTWTFYKFRTNKGDVTLRWYGSSNGYYSERVDFVCSRKGKIKDFSIKLS